MSDKDKIKRSISMPVKPRYLDDHKSLERSEEKETLFSTHDLNQVDEIDEKDESSDNEHQQNQYKSHSTPRRSSLPDLKRESNNDYISENSYRFAETNEKPSSRQRYDNGSNENTIHSPCVYDDPNAFEFHHSQRVISSSGYQNVRFIKIPKRGVQYLKDLITTLVEWKWVYTLLLFISGYFIVWYLCTIVWYIIASAHGDLAFNETTGERMNDDTQPCVVGADTFTGLFIYTMETQSSIGFGERYPTDECPEGVVFYAAQLVVYIGVEGMLISMVYMKISRPSRQMAKPKFSKRAVVCLRNGKHCLVIRICDRQNQQSIGTKITIYLLQNRSTREGEYIQKAQTELKLEDNGQPCLLWPTTVCHVIDKSSPFYKYTAQDFANKQFEIVVSCTGTSASTGQFTEYITSYVPNEVYWGERFKNIIHYDWERESYVVDYDNFDKTVSVGMPMHSAHQFWRLLKATKQKVG